MPSPEQQARTHRLGQYIRKTREKKGVSGQELAAAVGVDQSAVSKWEAGRARPSPDNRQALEDALDLARGALSLILEPALKRQSERDDFVIDLVMGKLDVLLERLDDLKELVLQRTGDQE